MTGPEYVRQWIDDFRDQRPGRRRRAQLDDRGFRRWLIKRRYAAESELATLDAWRNALLRDHFDIRPSIEVTRSWQLAEAIVHVRRNEFVTEVRAAIDRVLSALGEPELKVLQRTWAYRDPTDRMPDMQYRARRAMLLTFQKTA